MEHQSSRVDSPPPTRQRLADLVVFEYRTVTTLYGWRSRGEGPPGYRIGHHVRYRREAIEIWLASRADQAT